MPEITIEVTDAQHRHIEHLQQTLAKRKKRIEELELAVEAGPTSAQLTEAQSRGYREGWKDCANSVMSEVQATKSQLERLRNAAFQSTLRESGGPGW